jgi:hypothetical protein
VLGDDGLLQAGRAADRGVLGEAIADCLDRRFLDMGRRVEIRFAGAQRQHVQTLGLQLRSLGRHGKRGGRLDSTDAICELKFHGLPRVMAKNSRREE